MSLISKNWPIRISLFPGHNDWFRNRKITPKGSEIFCQSNCWKTHSVYSFCQAVGIGGRIVNNHLFATWRTSTKEAEQQRQESQRHKEGRRTLTARQLCSWLGLTPHFAFTKWANIFSPCLKPAGVRMFAYIQDPEYMLLLSTGFFWS